MKTTQYLKSLLTLNGITIVKLAELMTKKTGKVYTGDSLSAKFRRGSISLNEAGVIAEILGYKVEFIKK